MNDRAAGLLEKYDLMVNRTWKGRGAILCDTDKGLKIFKEYTGPRDKAALQDNLLNHIKEAGTNRVEGIVKNIEEEYLTFDQDRTAYILKDYFQGQECNVRDTEDCRRAVLNLAKLHKEMYMPVYCEQNQVTVYCYDKELRKHNKELKKVYHFIRHKSQKNDFEIYLMNHYSLFLEKAQQVEQDADGEDMAEMAEQIRKSGSMCHGEYQYHNLLYGRSETATVNFEKCTLDSQMRDLYLFMRKLLEKNNWSESIAQTLFETYDKEKTISAEDKKQLYYRFAYPEKFWKIVNFYYNTGKAWIPEKNMDKLEKLLSQEKNREQFLRKMLQ